MIGGFENEALLVSVIVLVRDSSLAAEFSVLKMAVVQAAWNEPSSSGSIGEE